jgi:two-component system LytT family response regulator
MIKVLIIDDEKRTRDLIARMIESFELGVTTLPLGEDVKSGIELIDDLRPNIVFLDVQLPDGTGFDVLSKVSYKNFVVIFVTAHEEFAIKAIKFSALDYLLKPIDHEELKAGLNKAILSLEHKKGEGQFEALQQNIKPNQKRKLVLKTLENIHVVDLDEIIRCEADRNYTQFYLVGGKKILVSKTMKDFETLLSPHQFLRVQQSHLINLNFVDRYNKGHGGSLIMKDGSEVPLSPHKRDMFFKFLENL